jgi:UDP-glucuronate 4-epimerase
LAILLTGGAGFIGSHVAERLQAAGRQVVILDNFDPYYAPALKRRNLEGVQGKKGVSLVEGDIRDRRLLERIADQHPIEAIIHLAARAGVRASVKDPLLCQEVNVLGTTELLELARRRKIPRFVFASSSSVYGERSRIPFQEDEPFDRPESPYAASKAAGEMLVWTYHRLFGLQASSLRFFTAYGPRQRPEMAIHRFTRLIERGDEVPVYGDGSARRDFTYIDDIAAGVIAALERGNGYRVYNLGNSATVEVRDLLKRIGAALGKPVKVRQLPPQPGDVSVTCASIERARRELDYRPSTPIDEGLRKFVAWYRAQPASLAGEEEND